MNTYEREHLARLRSYLAECTVLLKKNGEFPMEQPGRIAAYGNGVRHTLKGGTGSGEVNSRFYITVEQGLKDVGFEIVSGSWLDAYDEIRRAAKKEFIKQIKRRAKEHHTQAIIEGMGAIMPEPEYSLPLDYTADAAIYVVSRICGEGSDRQVIRGDFLLTQTEIRDILALNQKYRKFMLVLNVGGPVDLSPVNEVGNILILSQLGVETGAVLADILLGKAYPSGKLATTWAKAEDYCAIGQFGEKDDTEYKEGIYVGYRYFDSVGKKALYSFGFGLGYGDFQIVPENTTLSGTIVTVSAKVKNTGSYAGKETVQVYVSCPAGKLDQPFQSLAGWTKTSELQPSEECEVSISFDMKDISSFDAEEFVYFLGQGDHILRIGSDSQQTQPCTILRLEDTVTIRKVRKAFADPGFIDWNRASEDMKIPANVPVIPISGQEFSCEVIAYDRTEEIEPKLEMLTDEQLALLNVGAFDPRGGIRSMIGNASISVAGAAGEAAKLFAELGGSNLVMADGPAGLRISRQYFTDDNGVHAIGDTLPESFGDFMPKIAVWMMNRLTPSPKKETEIKEQYATAIPIGTAIAQSWNMDFARLCGDVVGAEMESFGIRLWLAPALNIHRNVLCGRNFEYYSEDPLISGYMAAAVTSGVQKHPGCGVTIKHFAANNQELNRTNNNSRISERALREIYLRGFEICVREAQPHAVMTSYNLINGIHTSESRQLTEDILRSEFGFDGLVMTDWVTAGGMSGKKVRYAPPNAGRVAAAGGNLFMPGSKKDLDEILIGLKDGTVSREQLLVNAGRTLKVASLCSGRSRSV